MSNLRMAETVCRMLELTRCHHFVYLSSEAVYGIRKRPLDEESNRQPVNLYGLAHTAREMMLESVLAKQDVPLCILRPANIYGPGDPHGNYGPNRFVRSALREGRIVLFGRGEERRSHLHIDDTVDLVIRAIRRRSSGVLNLVYAPAVSFLHAAKIVARHSPRPVELQFEPRVLPIVHQTYSAAAIFAAFPDFSYTPLERGIADYLRAMESAPGDEARS
jgi:UDP-glucose 4-epimerase